MEKNSRVRDAARQTRQLKTDLLALNAQILPACFAEQSSEILLEEEMPDLGAETEPDRQEQEEAPTSITVPITPWRWTAPIIPNPLITFGTSATTGTTAVAAEEHQTIRLRGMSISTLKEIHKHLQEDLINRV